MVRGKGNKSSWWLRKTTNQIKKNALNFNKVGPTIDFFPDKGKKLKFPTISIRSREGKHVFLDSKEFKEQLSIITFEIELKVKSV